MARVPRKPRDDPADDPALPENAALVEQVCESRVKWAHEALDAVVAEAARYGAEQQRRDPLHRGRMSRRRDALLAAVRRCCDAWEVDKPITAGDLAMARWIAAKRGGQSAPHDETSDRPVPAASITYSRRSSPRRSTRR